MVLSLLAAGWCTIAAFMGRRLTCWPAAPGAPDAAGRLTPGRSRRGRVSLSGEFLNHWCQRVQVVDEE
jgi:hypothetical protein